MELIRVQDVAVKLGLGRERVRQLLRRGTIPGAQKVGRDWLIPADAPLPFIRPVGGGRLKVCAGGCAPAEVVARGMCRAHYRRWLRARRLERDNAAPAA